MADRIIYLDGCLLNKVSEMCNFRLLEQGSYWKYFLGLSMYSRRYNNVQYHITHSNLFYTLKGSFWILKKARTILNGYERLDEVNLDFETMINTVWQTYAVLIIFLYLLILRTQNCSIF
jgi:hypothetical protein